MKRRPLILAGMFLGALWAFAVLWLGARVPVPIGLIQPVLMGAVFGPGLVLILMIGRLAQRRFFDESLIDGQPPELGTSAAIDQRVLSNTLEQTILALCIWPLVGFVGGAGMVLTLSIAFVVTRLVFWVGYHISPPLRAFGFAGTFYPTIAAAGYTIFSLSS